MSLLAPLFGGLRTKPFSDTAYLKLGSDMLNWMQEEQDERERQARLGLLEGVGLIVSRATSGQLGGEWMPYEDPSNAGELLIGDCGTFGYQSFVDADGYLVTAETTLTPTTQWTAPLTQGLTVAADSTWRTVVVRKSVTRYAPGTITFNSSSTSISGTGTDFTRFAGATTNGLPVDLCTKIRVDSADNATLAAASPMYVGTVTNATTAALTANPAASATVPFSIQGSYQAADPSTAADRDIYQRIVPEFEIVTRTTAPAAGDLVLADVWYDGGTLKIRDRRRANILSYRAGLFEDAWVPAFRSNFDIDTSSAFTGVTLQEWQFGNGDDELGDMVIAISSPVTSEFLVIRTIATTGVLAAITYNPNDGTAGKGTMTSIGTVDSTGDQPTLLYTKTSASTTGGTQEHTHICAYIKSGILYVKTSTDFGANWSGGSVWDPTSIDASDTVSDPQIIELRNGRIRIFCVYHDASAATYSIRSIYSDDVGGTWTTNSDAGTNHVSGSTRVRKNPTVGQDIRNGRIWLAFEEVLSGVTNISVGSDADETGQSLILSLTSRVGDAMDSSTPSDQCEPAMWVAPNGVPVIVYVERKLGASGFLDLRFSVMGPWTVRSDDSDPAFIYELYNRHIQRLTDASTHGSSIASATDRVRPCLCQGTTGPMYVTYVVPGPSGGGPVDLYMVKVMDIVKMPLAGGQFM